MAEPDLKAGELQTNSAGYLANLTFANGFTEGNGGGVRVMNGVFTNCVFTGNVATNGGGVYVVNSNADIHFFDCIFTNNRAIATGGGVRVAQYTYKYMFERCSFFDNKSGGTGGGAYFDYSVRGTDTALVTKCDFFENEAGANGGGFYAYGVRVEDCNIHSNKAINAGGGMNFRGATAAPSGVPIRCQITHNEANTGGGVALSSYGFIKNSYIAWNVATNGSRSGSTGGGGLTIGTGGGIEHCTVEFNSVPNSGSGGIITSYGPIVRNCLIRSNNAYTVGGLYITRTGFIENCTITGNVSSNNYGGLYMRGSDGGANYRNNIIYGNTGGSYSNYYAPVGNLSTFENNCTLPALSEAYDAKAFNNIYANPLFVDMQNGDFRLAGGSPCIDAGTNLVWHADALDLDKKPRLDLVTGIPDIGACEYEYRGALLLLR